jgi:hypothetical protein
MNRYHKPPGVFGKYIFPGFLLLMVVVCIALRLYESEEPKPILPSDSIAVTARTTSCASAQCNLIQTYHMAQSLTDVIAFYQQQGARCTQQAENNYLCTPFYSARSFTTPAATHSVYVFAVNTPSAGVVQSGIVVEIFWTPWL